jgi:hypothetical protein
MSDRANSIQSIARSMIVSVVYNLIQISLYDIEFNLE